MIQAAADSFRDLLLFIAFMTTLGFAALLVTSKLPNDNPLKRIVSALSTRIGVTLLAGVVAVPVEAIPVLDIVYDIAMPLFLLVYWFRLFTGAALRGPPPAPPASPVPAQNRLLQR